MENESQGQPIAVLPPYETTVNPPVPSGAPSPGPVLSAVGAATYPPIGSSVPPATPAPVLPQTVPVPPAAPQLTTAAPENPAVSLSSAPLSPLPIVPNAESEARPVPPAVPPVPVTVPPPLVPTPNGPFSAPAPVLKPDTQPVAPPVGVSPIGVLEAGQLPAEIRGWNWGAFTLGLFWGISHSVWIVLLGFVPLVGLVMPFILGAKGSEWAWQHRRFESVAHFQKVQRVWALWGATLWLLGSLLGAALLYLAYVNGQSFGISPID